MPDIRPLQVAGSGVHSTDNIAAQRTDIRLQRERELREQQTFTPAERELERRKQIAAAYAESYRREQEQKAAERAEKIRTGVIVLNPDGSETEYLNGHRRK